MGNFEICLQSQDITILLTTVCQEHFRTIFKFPVLVKAITLAEEIITLWYRLQK
jgi:hypothetical protein